MLLSAMGSPALPVVLAGPLRRSKLASGEQHPGHTLTSEALTVEQLT